MAEEVVPEGVVSEGVLSNNLARGLPDLCKNSVVSEWLAERNELIVQYCKLSGTRNQPNLPALNQLNQFCDILIDYVSAGHFEIYEKIVSACEVNGPTSLELLERLYPQISKTTDIVVDFNDKYSKNDDFEEENSFDNDLSLLGEALAKRVELEDSLIDTLRAKH
ncbi:sigma D regulator [Aliikangiella sp. G2MR2-5]|uniref:sigma D regulator n=1 Tax=Aliikangiella sp. G2MR2-5 TaxID=2788943 RepID=UPI0018AB5A5D|nr:sigma D regulator [Aliikangiella sp. G2MR2-5]